MKKILIAVTFLFSASAFALGGYAQLRGGFERSSGGNGYGGGASVGATIAPKIGIEGYFDYFTVSGTGDPKMMHFGGKAAFFPMDYLFIKAGAGVARTSITVAGISASSSDLELVGNVGVALPIAPAIAFTVEGQYTRQMSDPAANVYGAFGGFLFKF
jgi:hypothetical protein